MKNLTINKNDLSRLLQIMQLHGLSPTSASAVRKAKEILKAERRHSMAYILFFARMNGLVWYGNAFEVIRLMKIHNS